MSQTLSHRTLLTAACLALPLVLGGCNGAFVGNIFVFFMAVGIFFGTLGLGRTANGGTASASRPNATDSRS